MMALLFPKLWIALALAVMFAGANLVSYRAGKANVRAVWNVEKLQASEVAREKELLIQKQTAHITEIKDEKIASINSRLVAALDSLRNRPERNADVSATNCKGVTGAGLSRPDAGFLEGEAARANTLRAGLAACYDQYDAITKEK